MKSISSQASFTSSSAARSSAAFACISGVMPEKVTPTVEVAAETD